MGMAELVQAPSLSLVHHLSAPKLQPLRKPPQSISPSHSSIKIVSIYTRGRGRPCGLRPLPPIQAANQPNSAATEITTKTLPQIKTALYQALQGTNRGIFGVSSEKKHEIEDLVKVLEGLNLVPSPTDNLDKVDGCWKLIYSTISILGAKRTKLGLRDFVSLGNFLQSINVAEGKAVNVIKFNVRGFKMFTGQLVVVASFKIASKSRVDIKYENSFIAPDQLMNIFQKNYDMLLAIFNPEGWLEISYIDESMRIGRDDKGNIFILERSETEKAEDYIV